MLFLYRKYSVPSASRSAKHILSCSSVNPRTLRVVHGPRNVWGLILKPPHFPRVREVGFQPSTSDLLFFDNNQRNISRGFQSRDMQAGVPACLQATTTRGTNICSEF